MFIRYVLDLIDQSIAWAIGDLAIEETYLLREPWETSQEKRPTCCSAASFLKEGFGGLDFGV